ncbi:MAG: hypothetical protein ACUVT0_05845 [Thermochromatium sp.]
MVVKESSIRRTRLGSVGVLALLGLAVSSQGCAEDPPRQPPPGPPRAAIDACLYKSFSASCYFEDGSHAITGTCQERGGDWVCVPDRAPPGRAPMPGGPDDAGPGGGKGPPAPDGTSPPRPRPPREAFVACLNRAQGSACLIQTPGGEVAGRCASDSQGLACIPTDPHHRPGAEAGAQPGRP